MAGSDVSDSSIPLPARKGKRKSAEPERRQAAAAKKKQDSSAKREWSMDKMTNLEKYNSILKRDLRAEDKDLNDDVLVYLNFRHWESVAHMDMVSDLEEAFGVTFETLDITSFDRYSAGIRILEKLGVDMSR